jgi:hypothetical protein
MDWIGYITAWLKYGSKVLEVAANLGTTVRSAFADIHIPQKSEYER